MTVMYWYPRAHRPLICTRVSPLFSHISSHRYTRTKNTVSTINTALLPTKNRVRGIGLSMGNPDRDVLDYVV